MTGEYMTIKEVSDYTGLSVTSVNRLRYTGQLAFRKLGSRILIEKSDLHELLERSKVEAWAFREAL